MLGTEAIRNAIRDRSVIEFRYKLQMRRVEPHTLGYDKSGDLVLCGWQTSAIKPGWRDFRVAKMSGLSTTGEHFAHARPGYNPTDSTMRQILERL